MNEILGWGIIGCSQISRQRAAAAIQQHPRCRLLSVLSRDAGRAEAFAREFGLPRWYDDLDRFLADPELGAVYVSTEPHRHYHETVSAARAGKHVICEKPMAMDLAECRGMVEICRASRVNLAVAFYRRYYPKITRMKELLDAGAIGKPVAARAALSSFYTPAPEAVQGWRVKPELSGGGPLMDVGSHYLDALAHLLGPPGEAQALRERLVQPYDVPDSETLLVRFAAGVHVTAHFNWNVPGTLSTFEVHGTGGALLASPLDGPELIIRTPEGSETVHLPRAGNTHAPLFADFTDRVLAGKPPLFTGEDGAIATAVIQAACASALSGRTAAVEAV